MDVPRCRHIKTNGTICGSPALRGQAFCYHHHLHDTHHASCYSINDSCVPLVAIEDARSVQVALSHIFNSLTSGTIDQNLARTLIYALQVASTNARHLSDDDPKEEPELETLVRETSPTRPWTLIAEPGHSVDLDLPDPPPLPDPETLLNLSPQEMDRALDRLGETDFSVLEDIQEGIRNSIGEHRTAPRQLLS